MAFTPRERFHDLAALFKAHERSYLAPLGEKQKQGKPKRKWRETVMVLGKRCHVHKAHVTSKEYRDELRREMPRDLSVNAVNERRSRGLDAFARPLKVAA